MTTTSPMHDDPAPPIARESWPIVAGFVVVGAALSGAGLWLLGPWGWMVVAVALALCAWCVWFFRDPQRAIPGTVDGAEPVISPADGVVCFVGPAQPPTELQLPADVVAGMTRVSVFMNVFNVHVNRSPVAGIVERVHYRPGKFFNASFDKASEHNERSSLVLRRSDGSRLVCVQIAGLIARRIVCRVSEGRSLKPGERYGLIRFGSRVDVYLPRGVAPLVRVGQASVAGETVLAVLPITPADERSAQINSSETRTSARAAAAR